MTHPSPLFAALVTLPIALIVMYLAGPLFARSSGWAALATRYPACRGIEGRRFPVTSLQLVGGGRLPFNYNNCLRIVVGPPGISLECWFPLLRGHEPIFLPWSVINGISEARWWGWKMAEADVRDCARRIRFVGKAAIHVRAAYHQYLLVTREPGAL